MRTDVDHGGIMFPVLLSLYINEMPMPSHHVELVFYTDDTIIIATSRHPALLVKYLETYKRPRAVNERMENHLRLEKHRDALR
jgi:hypothetical protein